MIEQKKSLNADEWIKLILGIAFLGGIFVRFYPVFRAGFPLNDGGMFLDMVRDLKASHYSLPEFTSYNYLKIPYAYPPFAFYVSRVLSDVFFFSEISLIQWLPPFINSLSIFVFYFLACEILGSQSRGALASAFYALTPAAFGWFVMGGGLTRSFGSLFTLLSILWVGRLFKVGGNKALVLSVVFCGLAILSHPEAGIHTAAVCILLWLFFGRTRRSLIYAMIVGVGTILLSSPWWFTVISYHGFTPFLSALHTGSYGTSFLLAFYNLIFSRESFVPILVVLRIVSMIWATWKKEYFLIFWVVIPYLVEPRSAPSIAFYPLCMLIALATFDALPYIFSLFVHKNSKQNWEFHRSRTSNIFLILLFMYLFVESNFYGFKLVNNSLSKADLEAMSWVRRNLPAEGYFLPITGVPSPEIDPFIEWFPTLTGHHSQTTIQGYEWLLGEKFYDRYTDLSALQICESVLCVEEWSIRTNLSYDYIVLQKTALGQKLIDSFAASEKYKSIYSTRSVEIYLFNQK
ncbi:MAG: glycosyltransferase family 39 protein [Anaerolineales bacterium]